MADAIRLRLEAVKARAEEIITELDEADELLSREGDEAPDDETRTATSGHVSDLETEARELMEERDRLEAQLEAREQLREAARDLPKIPGGQRVIEHTNTDVDPLRANRAEMRDAALAILEREARNTYLSDDAAEKVERLIRSGSANADGDIVARRLALTENEHYRSAWAKMVANPGSPAWTSEESRAVHEFRAGPQSLTGVSGGFGVPVLIDPTIILTTGASDAPILRVSRIENITTNVWKGVSAAPASWSYDAEGAAVSDDSITVAQPVVTTYMARAFIPYTIEIGQDYPNFANEMRRVLSEGYVQKIASQSMTGSGSAPLGIFTAIDANAAREVVVTTSGSLAPDDALEAWNALGEMWRSNASWFSSVSVESQIRVPAANFDGLFTVDLNSEGLRIVNARPYYTTDYAPAFSGTTGTVNLLVVGDFRNYVIAQRAGMNVEFDPILYDGTTGRPTGQRGLFAYARHGMDSVNDNAFVLLKNAT